MTVKEPNDIAEGDVRSRGLENFAAIVYEKSQTNPGLKQLGLADMKEVLDYNSRKADNIARLCGFPKDTEIDQNCYDYKDGDVRIPTEGTLASQIQAVAANAGVPVTQSSPLNPLAPRLAKVETNLGTLSDDPDKTLMERMHDAEAEISGLAEEIGGYSPSGTPLTNRVGALEATVNGNGEPGLTAKVADLESTVGTSSSGLVKDVAQLKDEVETASTGLMDQVTAWNDEVGSHTEGATGTLNERVAQNTSDISDLKATAASAYKIQGTLIPEDVPTWLTSARSGSFKNGYVWDCSEQLTIENFNGKNYTFGKGANFVYILPEDAQLNEAYLDELGMNLDTASITNRLSALEGKFTTNNGTINNWDSSTLVGTYLISGYKKFGQLTTTFAFIGMFDIGGTLMTNAPIDLNSNFGDLFEVDSTTGKIKMRTATGFLSQLNTLKLS